MKILPLAAALLLTLAAAACSDSPTDSNNNTNFVNKASATLNGDTWTAESVTGTRNSVQGFTTVTFVAYGPDNSHFSFGIALASVNSFSVAPTTGNQADYKYKNLSYAAKTGTVKIDAISDKGMRGSFNVNGETSTGTAGTAVGTFEVAF